MNEKDKFRYFQYFQAAARSSLKGIHYKILYLNNIENCYICQQYTQYSVQLKVTRKRSPVIKTFSGYQNALNELLART